MRPLYDDGASAAQDVTRDYVLKLEADGRAPLLNIIGGKITTYRRLAEQTLKLLAAAGPEFRRGAPWTANVPLPGGDFPVDGADALAEALRRDYPFLDARQARRLVRSYGTTARKWLGERRSASDCGRVFGGGLTEAEVVYLMEREFALTAADVVWRRTRLGLVMSADEIAALDDLDEGAPRNSRAGLNIFVSFAASPAADMLRRSRHKEKSRMLDLHYWPTPNGKKMTILLEELGVPYRIVPVQHRQGRSVQGGLPRRSVRTTVCRPLSTPPLPTAAGRSICSSPAPSCCTSPRSTGASILRGCARAMRSTSGCSGRWPIRARSPGNAVISAGSATTKGDASYAVRRFTDEVNRLYGVLNNRLYDRRYIAGGEYTIADMISYPWSVNWQAQGQDIAEFKYFKRWFDELSARPAVQRGMAVKAGPVEDAATLSEEEKERRAKLLYNQRARPAPEAGGIL